MTFWWIFRGIAVILSIYFAFRAFRSFSRPEANRKPSVKRLECAYCRKSLSWRQQLLGCVHCSDLCALRERSSLGGGRTEMQCAAVDPSLDRLQPAKGLAIP